MGTGGVRRLAGRINAQLALAPRISLEQRLGLGQTVGIGIVAVQLICLPISPLLLSVAVYLIGGYIQK